MKMYYFGCVKNPGHLMFNPRLLESNWVSPWGITPDGTLCPKNHQVQGQAIITNKNGWTALSFWDRSVDSRLGANSNFFAEGMLSFEEMVESAKTNFPTVWSRYKFKIIPEAVHLKLGRQNG